MAASSSMKMERRSQNVKSDPDERGQLSATVKDQEEALDPIWWRCKLPGCNYTIERAKKSRAQAKYQHNLKHKKNGEFDGCAERADLLKDSDDDPVEAPRPAAALDAAKAAAWALLKENSNRKGGVIAYQDTKARLANCLSILHEPMRQNTQRQLAALERSFDSKTLYTWKPHVVCILKLMGANEDEVARAIKSVYLEREQVMRAEAEGKEDGQQADVKPQPKKRSRKESLAIEGIKPEVRSQEGTAVASEVRSWTVKQEGAVVAAAVTTTAAQVPIKPEVRSQVGTVVASEIRSGADRQEGAVVAAEVTTSGAQAPASSLKRFFSSSTASADPACRPARDGSKAPQQQKSNRRERVCKSEPPATSGEPPKKQARGVPKRAAKVEKVSQKSGSSGSAAASTPTLKKEPQPAGSRSADSRQASGSSGQQAAEDPHGYYAVLGVNSHASQQEIKAAYRRRAIETHPDKGGTNEAFQQVMEAFESLSREKAAPLEAEVAEADADCEVDARACLGRLLLEPKEMWPSILRTSSLAALETLSRLQEDHQNDLSRRGNRRSSQKAAVVASGGTANHRQKGIIPTATGYRLKMGWRNFYIQSAGNLTSLEQAVNLHILLVQIKCVATERFHRFRDALEEVGAATTGSVRVPVGCLDVDADDVPPMTKDELSVVMQAEPFVGLQFSSDLRRGPRRIMSPFTPNLQTSLAFRSQIRRVLAKEDGAYQDIVGPIAKLKNLVMEPLAAKERLEQATFAEDAIRLVKEALCRKRQQEGVDGPPRKVEPLPLQHQIAPLALQDDADQREAVAALQQSMAEMRTIVEKTLQLQVTAAEKAGEAAGGEERVEKERVERLRIEKQLEQAEKETLETRRQLDAERARLASSDDNDSRKVNELQCALLEKDKELRMVEKARDAAMGDAALRRGLQRCPSLGTSNMSMHAIGSSLVPRPLSKSLQPAAREMQSRRPQASSTNSSSSKDGLLRAFKAGKR